MDFIFDTNIFNRILDDKTEMNFISDSHTYYVTHIQLDEIKNTSDPARKRKLLDTFEDVGQIERPTESAVIGESRIGKSKIGDGQYDQIKNELDKYGSKENNKRDALIAETAMKNNWILVSNDGNLLKVCTMQKFDIPVMNYSAFKKIK